jgi:hypothetical protein
VCFLVAIPAAFFGIKTSLVFFLYSVSLGINALLIDLFLDVLRIVQKLEVGQEKVLGLMKQLQDT